MKDFNEIKDLIAKVISGDNAARDEFCKFSIPIIRKYVFPGLPKEDITNEVMIIIFRNDCHALRVFRNHNKNSLRKYLKVITQNYCRTEIKNKEKSNKIESFNFKEDFSNICPIPESEQPEQIFEENEKKRIIMEAVHSLQHILGVVMLLSLQDFKIKEIAQILLLNRKTVETRYNRAKLQLGELLKNAF